MKGWHGFGKTYTVKPNAMKRQAYKTLLLILVLGAGLASGCNRHVVVSDLSKPNKTHYPEPPKDQDTTSHMGTKQ